MNTDLSPNIIQIFINFIEKDPELLKAIINSAMPATEYYWQFTLPELHKTTKSVDPLLANLNYNSFRSLLFNSSVNKQLKARGAEIIIVENKNKVDLSIYALKITDN